MNIFVANLDYDMRERELGELFSLYGAVDSAKVITDKFTKKSKGFGFVEMPNEKEALSAIEDLNGSEFHGKDLVVKQANPRKD
ncbi:RNA-binding protein [Fulvivirgaceae bacterium BMA10]|uniref:RNA-binding protein n=1 Tax=Splendidivirga corallicola TaxID=3051826 RepID=A0ABT8KYH4_9BACT|nr:RNA-binding protein [Fulvivirgaceae bacterium BMA10]